MATGDRDPRDSLDWSERIGAAPRHFFGLVPFLERLTSDAARVGGEGPPFREAIRFRHDPDLGFHSADTREVEVVTSDRPRFEVVTTFLGLSGSASPLPPHIAEGVLFDTFETGAQRDLLDLFHHRAISLLYRATMRLDPAREHRSDASDPWLHRLLGLAGVHDDSGLALEARHLMVLIPVLAKRSRGALALRTGVAAVLRDELPHANVELRELVGRWISIDEDQCTRLGVANHTLGAEAILGRRVYDRRGRFAIRLGVLSREQASWFTGGGPVLDRLRAAVSLILRDPLEYDLELVLEPGASETMRLGVGRLTETRLSGFQGTEVILMRDVGRDLGVNRSLV